MTFVTPGGDDSLRAERYCTRQVVSSLRDSHFLLAYRGLPSPATGCNVASRLSARCLIGIKKPSASRRRRRHQEVLARSQSCTPEIITSEFSEVRIESPQQPTNNEGGIGWADLQV